MTDTERELLILVADWIADHEERTGAAFGLTTIVSEKIRQLLKQIADG
jgi:hypothetical protein